MGRDSGIDCCSRAYFEESSATYAMIAGAIVGGLVGGAGLGGTVNYMIEGTKGIVSAIVRIVAAGVLVGT